MKIKRITCLVLVCLLALLLSSCVIKQDGVSTGDSADSKSGDTKSYNFSIIDSVYEQGATNNEPDEFSVVMANDPINTKMRNDLLLQDISDTREAQVFFDSYAKIWQDELSYSINNLKKYLSDEDAAKLDIAQANWENNWKSNMEFDRSLIENNEIFLGTQYVSSALIHQISQYRDRVFHIKYMTYLTENHIANIVPKHEQLWDKFHEFV